MEKGDLVRQQNSSEAGIIFVLKVKYFNICKL